MSQIDKIRAMMMTANAKRRKNRVRERRYRDQRHMAFDAAGWGSVVVIGLFSAISMFRLPDAAL